MAANPCVQCGHQRHQHRPLGDCAAALCECEKFVAQEFPLAEGDVIVWDRDPCTVIGFRANGMLVDVARHGDGQVLCLPRHPVDGPIKAVV